MIEDMTGRVLPDDGIDNDSIIHGIISKMWNYGSDISKLFSPSCHVGYK